MTTVAVVGAISDRLAPFLELSTVGGKVFDSPETVALLVRDALEAAAFPPGRCSDDDDEDADDDDSGVDRKVWLWLR